MSPTLKAPFVMAVLAFAGLTAWSAPASALAVLASNNATVQPGGPRTGANGLKFLNVEGSGSGSFASYGVADFSLAAQGASTVTALSISLTESDAAFTAPGALNFYLVTDTATSIAAGLSPLVYDATALPDGLAGQLGARYLIGTALFTTTGNTNTGAVDTYGLTLSGAAQNLVDATVTAGGTLRLVVAPGDLTVAATFSGYSNTALSGPQLNLTVSAVPEADTAAMLLAGLTALALLKRRQRG